MNRPAPSAGGQHLSAAVPALSVHLSCLFFLSVLTPDAGAADIYRCTLADGTVVYQDQKCRGGNSQVLRSAGQSRAISEARLRQWLEQQPADRPQAVAPNVPPSVNPPSAGISLPGRPQSETLLAVCSERVLQCAGEGPRQMDGCISRISPCSNGRQQGCCAPSFVERYQLLRDAEMEQRAAVRGALLGIAGE